MKLVLCAEMTRQAQLRPIGRAFRGVKAGRNIVGVANLRRVVVRRQPILGAAMAGFAANTVRKVEFLTASIGRYVVGMAIEADARRLRVT